MALRAISTVLDVSLFLLLVGAAAATLAHVPAETAVDGGDPADEAAEVLATSTATVQYSIEPGLDREQSLGADARFDPYERTVQDAVANLLGSAAVASAELDGRSVIHHGAAFERRVANVTESRVRRENVSTAVRAHWTPYPGAPIAGTVRAGERPPPAVDVRAATVTVDSGVANVSAAARSGAAENGFDGLATVLANATLEGVLPQTETRLSLRGDYPSSGLTLQRYRQVALALDFSEEEIAPTDGAPSRAELEATLVERFGRDLRDRYDDPSAAAADVRIDHVTITVRTWSR